MYISVDIGGTNTRIALSDDGQNISRKEHYKTPQNYHEALALLTTKLHSLLPDGLPHTVVIAVPGVLLDRQKIYKTPHLPDWEGENIKTDLESQLHTSILLENDADLGGLAESRIGAGREYDIVAYLTLSTGIGGSRITQGQIDPTQSGFEPGHHIIKPNGPFWPYCGQHGCFESLASGTAFEHTYHIKPELCEDPLIWEDHAKITSQGLANLIYFWSPRIVVLGGSLTKAGDKFINPLIRLTQEQITMFPMPEIVVSTLGGDNVLLGGLLIQQ
jgi:predicted NBD/HSP70 family sugar kinase